MENLHPCRKINGQPLISIAEGQFISNGKVVVVQVYLTRPAAFPFVSSRTLFSDFHIEHKEEG